MVMMVVVGVMVVVVGVVVVEVLVMVTITKMHTDRNNILCWKECYVIYIW
jgi:hypothetical protein